MPSGLTSLPRGRYRKRLNAMLAIPDVLIVGHRWCSEMIGQTEGQDSNL